MTTKVTGPNGMFKLHNDGMSRVVGRYKLATDLSLESEYGSVAMSSLYLLDFTSPNIWQQDNTITNGRKMAVAVFAFPTAVDVAYVEMEPNAVAELPDKVNIHLGNTVNVLYDVTDPYVTADGTEYLSNIVMSVDKYTSPINVITGVNFIRITMINENATAGSPIPSLKNLKVYVRN